MLNIDPRTIVFIIIISTMMMSISLLSVWKVYFSRIRSVRRWAVAIFLESLGWLFYAFRGYIPDFLSIILANTLIILSLAIFFNVLAEFNYYKIKKYWAYVIVSFDFFFLMYFTYVHRDYTARIGSQSVTSAALMLATAYILLSKRRARPSSHLFTGIMFLIGGLILASRILVFMRIHSQPDEGVFAHNTLQDISYVSFYIMAVMLSFGFILMCNDRYVLENNRTEQLLKKSEERYRNIVETAQEGIWLLDEYYNTVFVNRKMAQLVECLPEEMIGKHLFEYIDEKDIPKANEAIERRKEGFSEIHEARLKARSGKYIWASFSSTPILIEQGKFSGSLSMVTDITDRMNSSEALKNSERLLKEAQKIARVGNYMYNFQTGIWKCSEVVDEISGLTREEVPHFEKWIALIAPEFREQYLKDFEDTIVHGTDNFGNYRDYKIIQAHTGEVKWVSITGEMEYDENGKPVQLFGTIQDVTERKKEEALIQANTELRNFSGHLQEIREQERMHISREIHDELGQQLTALKIETTRLSNKIKVNMPDFASQSQNVLEMLNNAISTVRKIATQLRPGLLNELGIEAAIESHTNEFQKTTGIKCSFDSNLNKDEFSEEINTNIFRIYQEALTNIARHAGASTVNTRLYQEDNMLMLEVKDDGIGFHPDKQNKKSLGIMGMKERAAVLNGEINFSNLPERGTLVTLKVPLSS
jgi:PAS domain S-box-containing protein